MAYIYEVYKAGVLHSKWIDNSINDTVIDFGFNTEGITNDDEFCADDYVIRRVKGEELPFDVSRPIQTK